MKLTRRAALAAGGRHVSIAAHRGRRAEIDLLEVMKKRLIVTGSTLRGQNREEKARIGRILEEKIWPLIAQKKVNPLVYKDFPIKNVAEAHKVMESGEHIGKMWLEVAG